MRATEIVIGACYSNGDFGRHWFVWQVADIRQTTALAGADEQVHYKVLVGKNRRKQFACSLEEFAARVRYRVELNENSWQRVTQQNDCG